MAERGLPGPVMLDLKCTTLSSDEREMLGHPAVGGVILFGRNYQSPDQVAALVAEVRAARNGDLLLAVDQEGGRVQRFIPTGADGLQETLVIPTTVGGFQEALVMPTTVGGFQEALVMPTTVGGFDAGVSVQSPSQALPPLEKGGAEWLHAGYTRLPAAARYLDYCHGDQAQAKRLAQQAGWLMAAEVRAVGVDFSFAPVLDVNLGVSQVIGDRAFARDAEAVANLAGAFMEGMREAGMPAVGKHFPGHGGVTADSHLALPVDERAWDDLWEADLLPYRRLIPQGLDAVMPAHVVYSRLDEHPAGFSRFWLQEVLRRRLGFQGVVFSDDLSMEGAAGIGDFAERARLALAAGCDMVLVCNNPAAAASVLESLGDFDAPESAGRLAKLQALGGVPWSRLRQETRWQQTAALLQNLMAGEAV